MATPARQARQPAQEPLLSIGQVLAKLGPDFPDITPSKLRFLEDRKLICPSRTESGYRKFSPADVERIRFVLTMQKEHYLPLKVIKAYLDEVDAGGQPELPGGVNVSMLTAGRRRQRDELIRESGASAQLLNDAVSASVIIPSEFYGDETVTVLRSLVELQKSGIEPRHLRTFRAAAERELGLIENALMPVTKRSTSGGQVKAAELAREIAEQLAIVRSSIIRSALERFDR